MIAGSYQFQSTRFGGSEMQRTKTYSAVHRQNCGHKNDTPNIINNLNRHGMRA